MILDVLFTGRMSRKNFILSQVVLMVVSLIVITVALGGKFSLSQFLERLPELQLALLMLAPVGLLFQFICSFRRLHDIHQSGLWTLLLLSSLLFIPFIDIVFLIYISYAKGDPGMNKYGNPDTRPLIDSLLNR